MLLKSLINYEGVYAQAYKFAIEICMDRMGMYYEVAEKPLGSEYITEEVRMPHGFKDVTVGNIKRVMFPTKEIAADKIPIAAMFAFLKKEFELSDSQLNQLRINFVRYITSHNQTELIKEYANTSMVENMVMSKLSRKAWIGKVKANLRGGEVVALFRTHLSKRNSSKAFERNSVSVLSFITHNYTQMFEKEYGTRISALMNEKGFTLEGHGEDGDTFDYSDEMPLEIENIPSLENFKEIAYNILSASTVVYKHKNDVFYDLWSRYKKKILNERCLELIMYLKSNYRNLQVTNFLKIGDSNYKAGSNPKYRKGIFNAREDILQRIEMYFNSGLPIYRYEEAFNEVISIDNTHQKNNGRRLFDLAKNVNSLDRDLSNADIFLMILQGFSSVKALADYCEKANIDPLTVPSTIFRNKNYYMRVPSFEDYRKTCNLTTQLMQEAYFKIAEPGIATNDFILETAVMTNNRLDLSALSRLQFHTIKELLFDDVSKSNDSDNVVKIAHFRSNWFTTKSREFAKYYERDFARLRKILEIIAVINKKFGEHPLVNFKPVIISPAVKNQETGEVTPPKTINYPVLWHSLPPQYLLELNKLDLTKFTHPYITQNRCKLQYFYDVCRYTTLSISISYRLRLLFQELNSPTLNQMSLFTVLEKYKDLLDLPRTINDISSVPELIENRMDCLPKSNMLHDLYNIMLCHTNEISMTSLNLHTSMCYNLVMQQYYPTIKYIRDLKARMYDDLNISGVILQSPFGVYHSAIVEEAKSIGVGIIASDSAVRNSAFMSLKATYSHESKNYQFLVSQGKAGVVYKGGQRYFVHLSGKLFNPDAKDRLLRISNLEENDIIKFI